MQEQLTWWQEIEPNLSWFFAEHGFESVLWVISTASGVWLGEVAAHWSERRTAQQEKDAADVRRAAILTGYHRSLQGCLDCATDIVHALTVQEKRLPLFLVPATPDLHASEIPTLRPSQLFALLAVRSLSTALQATLRQLADLHSNPASHVPLKRETSRTFYEEVSPEIRNSALKLSLALCRKIRDTLAEFGERNEIVVVIRRDDGSEHPYGYNGPLKPTKSSSAQSGPPA